MFTRLYLTTTNPELSFSELMAQSGPIFVSAVFHTVVYVAFVNVVWFIFTGSMVSNLINQRLSVFLLAVMLAGYVARFYHVKEIYQTYQDKALTRKHVDQLYIGWIFIA